MGTVKYTGPVASFHCPTNAEIRSLKVHFSPKQEGTGDPSPSNVRPIVGWDGVEAYDWTSTNASTLSVPSEYKKVEYLESTGTQYIATSYIPVSGAYIDFKYLTTKSYSNDEMIFGATESGVACYAEIYDKARWYASNGKSRYSNVHGNPGRGTGINDVYTAHMDSDKLIVDGYIATPTSQYSKNLTYPIYIFAWNSSGNAQYLHSALRLYELKFLENDVLSANFVPCLRKSDNKPGMYDTVSQTFYTNAGTGEFLYGPEVSGYTTDYEFGVLGKNKLNADAEQQAPSDTASAPATKRIFTLNTYCVGMSWSNYYISNQVTAYSVSNSTITITNNNVYGLGYPVQVAAGQTYYLSAVTTNGRANIAYFAADGTYISGVSTNMLNSSFTVPNDIKTAVIIFYSNSGEATFSNIQLELGSTATAYEPYNPNHTVYGGWVDLVSGEVCEKYNKITVDGETRKATYVYKGDGSYGAGYVYVSPEGKSASYKNGIPTNIWCENFPLYIGVSSIPTVPYVYAPLAGALYTVFYIASIEDHPELEDASARREYVNNWLKQNPVIIVYELATPNTYHLVPTALQTFLGQNNVWSNADYVEVEYDLHETQTILERKAFILANQAKIKTATGAPATFTTTTHAPLKSAKVYFTPVQTGSGTPSPTNVRPILGWKQAGLVINRGKNLINEDALVPNTGIDASGNNRTWDTTKANDFLYLPPGDYILTGTYTGTDASANLRVHGYSHEQKWLKQITYQAKGPNQSYSIPFTMTADMPYMRFSANKNVTNIQLEEGSTATTYETFSGRELSVNWGNVIYGGYVDLISGEVWKTYGYYSNITAFTGAFGPTAHGYAVYLTYYDGDHSIKTPICDRFIYSAAGYTSMPSYSFGGSSGASITFTFILDSTITSKAEADAWLANNPISVAYGLATPQLVATLTLSQLSDFVRTNIVTPYSNSNVEVQYWTH